MGLDEIDFPFHDGKQVRQFLLGPVVFRQRDFLPVHEGNVGPEILGDLVALFQKRLLFDVHDLSGGCLADHQFGDVLLDGLGQNPDFVVAVLGQFLDRVCLDRLRPQILFRALAREDLGVDHRAFHTRRHAERRVAHIAGLFTENRPQQFFFGGQLRFTLGRDLADQDIARLYGDADADDAAFVEVAQRLLANVGNIARDLFLAQLGVAGHGFEFFNVN